jgi:hypothetical protein
MHGDLRNTVEESSSKRSHMLIRTLGLRRQTERIKGRLNRILSRETRRYLSHKHKKGSFSI